jgi:uncharacterized iron-regulated membrane protein
MGQAFAISGWAGWLIVTLPVIVLTAVVVWAVRNARADASRPSAISPPPDPVHAQMSAGALQAREAETVLAIPQQAVASAETQVKSVSPGVDDPERFSALIADARAKGDKDAVATLYIEQAQAHLARSQHEEAAARLRDAIGVAALGGLDGPHAAARVELAGLYLEQGDPITACEQWQIARQLFHQLKRPTDRDAVDRRMLDNGCPTDWVLTDF